MCGRYASLRPSGDLATVFDAADATGGECSAPNYNVAPTNRVPVIRTVPIAGQAAAGRDGSMPAKDERGSMLAEDERPDEVRVVSVARWGLLPPWATDPRAGARMINARAETVRTSRAYRAPFEARRCLVPADGWYEWVRQPDRRAAQAYYVTPRDGQVLAFAGLWQTWGPDRLLTTTVLTTDAVGDLATIHHRMPLVLPAELWTLWLTAGPSEAAAALESPTVEWAAGMELRAVSRAVGNVRNNSPALLDPVTDGQPAVDAPDPIDLTLF